MLPPQGGSDQEFETAEPLNNSIEQLVTVAAVALLK